MKKFMYILSSKDTMIVNRVIKNSIEICNRNYKMINNALRQKNDKDWQPFDFEIIKMILDEDLCEQITNLISEAHSLVPNIKTSNAEEPQDYAVRHVEKIESVVSSIITVISYNLEEYDIFDFVSLLLFRITNAHAYENGNKRTGIVATFKILDYFGLYIRWSSNRELYIKHWEEFMLMIAQCGEKNTKEEDCCREIKLKLLDNVWLNLNKKN